jgi:hypothetical protein
MNAIYILPAGASALAASVSAGYGYDDLSPILYIVGMIAVAAVAQITKGEWDRGRIRKEIESKGGRVVSIEMPPLFSGRAGGRGDRTYEVRYTTRRGRTVFATCKTSMLSGVYWIHTDPPE